MWRHFSSTFAHIHSSYRICVDWQSFVRINYNAEESRISLMRITKFQDGFCY
uniref:Uncharacterized protein n=1 Tax=Meloidogyne incognita TaxID=6306 RepID=A0A914KZQ8_MELIC